MALADRNDIWETLGAGGYSAMNELLFGLPDWMVKKVGSSEAIENLARLREENKLASGIGTGLGLVGGMLIPVGGLAKLGGKGLTLGAKALGGIRAADKITDIAKLGGLAGQLGTAAKGMDRAGDVLRATKGMRGALLRGASQAVPQALFTADNAEEGIKQAALGTLLGGGAELGMNKLIPKVTKGLSNKLDDLTIRGATGGEANKVVKDVLTGGMGAKSSSGNVIQRGPEYKGKLAQFIRDNKITSLDDVRKVLDTETGAWSAIGKAAEKAGLKPATLLDDILKDPRIQNIIGQTDNGMDILNSVIDRSSRTKGWASTREVLRDFMIKANQSPDMDAGNMGKIAAIVREKFDDASMKIVQSSKFVPEALRGKDLGKMKETWRSVAALQDAAARDMSKVSGATGGSDTFIKQELGKIIGGGALGAGAGAANKEDPLGVLGGAMLGAAGGAALNKAIPKLVNKAGGQMANTLSGVAAKGASGELGQGLGRAVSRTASRDITPEVAQKVEEQAPGVGQAISDPATMESAAPASPEEMAAVAPKRKLDSQYNMMVIGALRQEYYKNKMYDQGMTLPEFVLSTFMSTNGFDPKMTANRVWPSGEQAAKFLSQLQARDVLQGLNTEALFNYNPIMERAGRYAGEAQLTARRELEKIDAALFNLRKGAADISEDFALKNLSNKLKQTIAAPGLTDEQKLAAVKETFVTYGYDPDLIQQYGV